MFSGQIGSLSPWRVPLCPSSHFLPEADAGIHGAHRFLLAGVHSSARPPVPSPPAGVFVFKCIFLFLSGLTRSILVCLLLTTD